MCPWGSDTASRDSYSFAVLSTQVTRVAREVGTEGKLGGQAVVEDVAGTWKELTESVNAMASNLTAQVRDIASVSSAIARGDLSQTVTVDVQGEMLQLKETVNSLVDQLRTFASEVTRVAREVGTEGALGGQAVVKDVAGTWKELVSYDLRVMPRTSRPYRNAIRPNPLMPWLQTLLPKCEI